MQDIGGLAGLVRDPSLRLKNGSAQDDTLKLKSGSARDDKALFILSG
jgi:hypothetical protein